MEYHNILVLEGGGAKGPLHVGELKYLENELNKKLADFIDLFATTSIGGVEASIYCTGLLTVNKFWKFLEPNLKNIFSARRPWNIPRYDWRKYKALYEEHVGKGIKFGDAKTKFMFTTVDLITGRNYFPKSWKDEFKNESMPDLVHRTFAAPFFFGGIYDNKNEAIWSDGGVGFFNLPLIEAYAQALTLGWLKEGHHTHILALGTGRKQYSLNYGREAKRKKVGRALQEVKRFMSKDSGGLARAASTVTQINTMRKLVRGYDNLTFQWIDWFPMPKKLDKMDNWKARWEYFEKGLELGKQIDTRYFKKKI